MSTARFRLRVERLRARLAESRLSQNHWAIKLGLSRGHWSDLLHGRHPYPSVRTRERLVEVLGIPFDELFEEEVGPHDGEAAFQAALRDRYLVDREIGQGGMGVVYLARDVRHGRPVAIKMVSPEAVGGIGAAQLLKEIRYTARLQHHHILPLFDSGVAAGRPFYVMPFIKGGSLRDLLRARRRLTLPDALSIIRGVADALTYAHDAQVLHCDIKPENILLSGPHPFVADFGISRTIHTEVFEWGPRHEIDSSAGTPAYVSPEQASGERNLDARSDVYSLACMTFEMLAGRPPFVGTTTMEVVSQRFTTAVPEIHTLVPEIARGVSDVINNAMALSSQRRPTSPAAFVARLEMAQREARAPITGFVIRPVRVAANGFRRLLGRSRPGVRMDSLINDLVYAVRAWRRRPAVLFVAMLTLALGIGASTAMFSVVNAVLLRPLAYVDPGTIVSVYPTTPALRGHPTLGFLADRATFSWPEVFAVRENQTSFTTVAAYTWRSGTLTGEGRPQRINMAETNWDLFTMLGITPLAGRLLTADDDPREGARVAVITAGFWEERFGREPDVIGQTMRVDDVAYTIVGVLPPDFRVSNMATARAWIPRMGASSDPGLGNHNVAGAMARLAPGVTVEVAQQDLERVMQSTGHETHGGAVYPRHWDETRTSRPALLVLIVASVLLLGVACGNVAAILLSTGIDRDQELAVRGALGASRGRIARQLLTESVLLSALGALGGIVIAYAATRSLLRIAPPGIPRLDEAAVDLPVLAFALVIGVGSGVLFGLVPALWLSDTDPGQAIASSRGTTSSRTRLHGALVVGELALATLLLVSGALLTRSLNVVGGLDPGFDQAGLLSVRVATPFHRFQGDDSDQTNAAVDGYFQRIVDEVASAPGVRGVAVSSNLPLTGDRSNNDVSPEGWTPRDDEQLVAERRFVSPNYFEIMRIPIVDGRSFDERDDRGDAAPTVIISEGLARRVWPSESAVGKRLSFWGREPATIIGVAANIRDESLEGETALAYYVPFRQLGAQAGGLLVRTVGLPAADVIETVRARIWAADPDIPITQALPMSELMADAVDERRYRARLMTIFAVLAATFAVIGIYGVAARSVSQRSRELAIRMALGAEQRWVFAMVVREGLALAALGGGIGILTSLVTGRYLEDLLFGVSITDPLAIGAVVTLLGLTAVVAGLPPARRATRVDPMVAMRTE